MKARELRIGNYIDIFGSTSQVVPSDFNPEHYNKWVTVEDNEYVIKSWKPIPLTEDWLLKFGFEDNSYALFYKEADNELYITVSFKDYAHTQLYERPVEVNDYSLPLDCKYVHQLQNLYFALTGEELTITEQ